jgi:hypothetical protein
VHQPEIKEEPGTRTNEPSVSTTQSATDSTQTIAEAARSAAVRHLAEDIWRAHAEGDAVAAQTLAKALVTLLGEDSTVPAGLIDSRSGAEERRT